jgi:hypothetical protein
MRRGEPEMAIAGRRTPERKRGPAIPLGEIFNSKGMAEPEGFEPSIRLYNRITV